jgi:prevent-host-death family protein
MDKSVSAAEANRNFSRLLREVREGVSFTVTSHGRPVARIVPAETEVAKAEAAWKRVLARLERQSARGVERDWTREELYDD